MNQSLRTLLIVIAVPAIAIFSREVLDVNKEIVTNTLLVLLIFSVVYELWNIHKHESDGG